MGGIANSPLCAILRALKDTAWSSLSDNLQAPRALRHQRGKACASWRISA